MMDGLWPMLTSAVVPLACTTATRVRSPERTRRARTLPRGSYRTLRRAIAHREQGDRLWRFPALDFSRSLSGRTPRARGGMKLTMQRNALLIVAALCAVVVSVHGAPPHSNRRRLASLDRGRVAIAARASQPPSRH